MKKLFLTALLLSAFCVCASTLRVDLTGLAEYVAIKSSLAGGSQSTKVNAGHLQRTVVLPSANQYRKFELTFTSPKDTELTITLRATKEQPVLVDDLTIQGAAGLKNGDFEKISKKKSFENWRGVAANVATGEKLVHSGKYCGKITYSSRLSQRSIKVRAGQAVTISGFYRREVAAPTQTELRKALTPAGSNVVFDPTFDKDKPIIISTGRLELHPTFENCSVYLNLLPEERNKKINVAFFFRPEGKGKFTEALPPAEVIQEHAWRGSLFNLKENTSYDFKALITGKNYKKEVTGKFRTRNSDVPFETVTLPAGKCNVKIVSGTPRKYKRYTSNGKTVTAAKGSVAVFELQNMENIIFENMVIDARGAQHGFKLDNCRNIIIRNCEIFNFGRENAGPRFGAAMYYNGGMHTPNGDLLYDDVAFRLFQSRNTLIERCFVHDPAYPSQTWLYAHPSGAGCIKVMDCANTVVRWNDFVGRDECRFIDHIIGPPNGSLRGGFTRDADIYGNLFAFSNDDGAELEGGAMNIRCYGNRIEGTLSGMSTGPISLGPTYLIGNLFANPGDDDGSFSLAYKNGGGTKGMNHTRGKYYALNNTVGDNWVGKYGMGNFSEPHKDYFPTCKAYLRNNTIRAKGRFYHRLWYTFKTDCDGNLLERVPGGKPENVAMDMAALKASPLEKHGIFAPVRYADARTGNYALKVNAPGYNKAIPLNNFPNFKHCGAYEGYPNEWFPKRPLAMYADKTELHWAKNDNSARTITLTAPAGMNFKVITSDSFFTVKPSGIRKSGKKICHTYTVSILREKMKTPRRYSGAILFRTDKGLSLPVTLFADGRVPEKEAIASPERFMRLKKISAKGTTYVFEAEKPAKGTLFMMVRGKHADNLSSGKVECTINGQSEKREIVKAGTSDWMFLRSFQYRRLVPVTSDGSRITVKFESLNGVTIEEVILTKEPWVLMRNREYPVKH